MNQPKITPKNEQPNLIPEEDSDVTISNNDPTTQPIKQGIKDRNTGLGEVIETDNQSMASGKSTTGGDPDTMQEQAKVVGEEAIGGTTPTPDQSDVDEIATSVGVNTPPEQPVEVMEDMQERDAHRFELDPDSKGPAASA